MNVIHDILAGFGTFIILAVAAAFIFWQVQKHKR